jgi:hypothetical protein
MVLLVTADSADSDRFAKECSKMASNSGLRIGNEVYQRAAEMSEVMKTGRSAFEMAFFRDHRVVRDR